MKQADNSLILGKYLYYLIIIGAQKCTKWDKLKVVRREKSTNIYK